MKLTKQNYFTKENNYISNSKIGDWLKCKNYFKRKHIDSTTDELPTDAMILGSAVDTWLTESEEKFRDLYLIVSRRTKKSPDYRYQLNQSMLYQVEGMCKAVEQTEAYKSLKGYTSQKVLQYDMDLGQFSGICGVPDWFKIKDGVCTIIDLKTAQEASSPRKWHYKCEDFGYYRQMAMYERLITANYHDIEDFEYKHLVVEKDKDGIHNVYTYEMDIERIIREEIDINDILEEIKEEKHFNKKEASWDDAVIIGDEY